MKSYVLPAILAGIVFVAGMAVSVSNYNTIGRITLDDGGLIFAAIALGVLAQRLYETEKQIDRLRDEIRKRCPVDEEDPAVDEDFR